MKPKICLSIQNLKDFSLEEFPFEGYELKSGSEGFSFNILKILKLKEQFKKFDLSLHTQLSRIFSCNKRGYPEFNEAELNLLKSEIIASKIIGIKQINFHMKEGILTEEEKKRFRKIIKFANEEGLEMIYESNSFCESKNVLRFLEDFPKINYALDFGHINIAVKSGKFGMDLMDFIEKIKSRIVHIHGHNNNGTEDSHKSIDEGNFPWRKVLDKLKKQNLKKIIIECKKKDDIFKTKRLLEEYYDN